MLMGACMLRSAAWMEGLMALSAMSRESFQDCDKREGEDLWRSGYRIFDYQQIAVMQIEIVWQQNKMASSQHEPPY
jgi:hypothetical protein